MLLPVLVKVCTAYKKCFFEIILVNLGGNFGIFFNQLHSTKYMFFSGAQINYTTSKHGFLEINQWCLRDIVQFNWPFPNVSQNLETH